MFINQAVSYFVPHCHYGNNKINEFAQSLSASQSTINFQPFIKELMSLRWNDSVGLDR